MAHTIDRTTRAPPQQTQNICITFIQCWVNVEDVGPTLHKCYTYVLCLLGCCQPTYETQNNTISVQTIVSDLYFINI